MKEPERPIFVVGCPRSGTTMLQLMLHAHPRIAIPPETRFLMAAYDARSDFGDLAQEANRLALARWIVDRKKTRFADLGLDGQQVVDEIVAGPPTLGSALGIVLRAYAARFGKPRWGDKRPGYFQRIPALLRMFPDAQVVQLIRDGRDCVASLKEMDWYKQDSLHALSTWVESTELGERAARTLGPDSYHRMYYERLISDPEKELSGLCTFLGEEFDPAMCEPGEVAAVAVPGRKTWHLRTHDEVTTARSGTWRTRLTAAEIALCETVAGDLLREHGYEVSGGTRLDRGDHGRYRRVAAHRRLAARKRDVLDLLRRRTEPSEVASRLC
ncbi:sulfotransferase [Actinoallomurus bryophytorum]|uniref:Sulfotransferase family protein n=1 Tax=Actinoallomurus bryophytorum TaxID=1490222 RepID=A0A543BZY4_9ACTN|nr:sulfotransferase [Actinoallomurus bryophytorum]TQL90391.1 sulfotransferase family protein [Actinoallomurus bryophytorum]